MRQECSSDKPKDFQRLHTERSTAAEEDTYKTLVGFGIRVRVLGIRVQGLRFGVSGFGFKFQGSEVRV